MDTFEMNEYDNDGRHTGRTITCNVVYFDDATELRIVENNGIYYVCDCEGDAQQRGSWVPSQLHNAKHAFIVLEFLKIEGMYFE